MVEYIRKTLSKNKFFFIGLSYIIIIYNVTSLQRFMNCAINFNYIFRILIHLKQCK